MDVPDKRRRRLLLGKSRYPVAALTRSYDTNTSYLITVDAGCRTAYDDSCAVRVLKTSILRVAPRKDCRAPGSNLYHAVCSSMFLARFMARRVDARN